MLIGEPQPSQYDWRFTVLGFPTRVTWLFWAVTAALGYNSARAGQIINAMNGVNAPLFILLGIWVAVVFVSILLHELGHALAFRYFGVGCEIVLYQMGGLAIPGAGMLWRNQGKRRHLSHADQIIISAAGPGIQLILAAIVGLSAIFSGIDVYEFRWLSQYFKLHVSRPINPFLFQMVHDIIFVNIWWAVLNLLPIYPMDGGKIAQHIFAIIRRTSGLYEAYALGAIAGLLVAIWFYQRGSAINAMFFAMMAMSNFQAMQDSRGPRIW